MKILFVVPPFPNRVKEYLILPSLELCIQAALLKEKGIEIELVDMKIDNLNIDDLERILNHTDCDMILIEDDARTHCNTKPIIKLIRKIYGLKVKIILKGEIASFLPEIILHRNPDLDYLIRFDDDYALLNIINALKNDNFEQIPNIAFRKNNNVVVNNVNKNYYDINKLPYPDRKIYSIEKYLKRDSETIVRSSRGCPGNCLFCVKTKMEWFRLFSIERFCNEIEELLGYGFETFFFSDDTFGFSLKRLTEFAEELTNRNLKIKWTSNLRIKDITDEKIALMKKLGAYRVFIGIETINEKTSEGINKNLKEKEILDKISILKKYNIEFHASFILGNPGDTEDDLKNMLDFAKKIQPTLVTFNLIKLFPGIDLYHNAEKYGMIMEDPYWFEKDDWSKRVIVGTEELSTDILDKWSKKALFEFINV